MDPRKHPWRKVDHVVAIGGGFAPSGTVSQITDSNFKEAIDVKALGVINAIQALIPLLKDVPTSTFTVITGLIGEFPPAAVRPDLALTVIGTCAQYGLTLASGAPGQEVPHQ